MCFSLPSLIALHQTAFQLYRSSSEFVSGDNLCDDSNGVGSACCFDASSLGSACCLTIIKPPICFYILNISFSFKASANIYAHSFPILL